MFIKKISYQSDETVLQDVEFQKINVLVGASGAGKTTIMDCINTIGHIANGNSYPGVSWRIEFTDSEKRHVIWSGIFAADLDYDDDEEVIAKLSSESVEIDGEEIVYRDATGFFYLGAKLPALDDTKSAIFHLKTDDLIQPVYSVFDSTVFISTTDSDTVDAQKISFLHPKLMASAADFFDHYTQADIKQLSAFLNIKSRTLLYFASLYDQKSFDDVVYEFTSIFPFIDQLRIQTHDSVQGNGVREAFFIELVTTSGEVIKQHKISSGMFKTLNILCNLYLTPPQTAIVIDEIENSLGVNCLPDILAELLSSDHQVILSSHHPKIINKIPIKHWLIVNRQGKKIMVSKAEDAGISNGNHDAFTRLMNSSLYSNGIQ